ncbi:hypothetical protein DIE08_14035 [Burkholderia sp. Bp9004]|nr:hypothetical protein DIE08_14035 [Burkholderia sp. Bp9004]
MNAHPTLSRAKWLIGCAVAVISIGAYAQSGGESAARAATQATQRTVVSGAITPAAASATAAAELAA